MVNQQQADPPKGGSEESSGPAHHLRGLSRPARFFVVFLVVLSACFGGPLYALVDYAIDSEFFSYILLIPFITLYLIWIGRRELPRPSTACWSGAAMLASGGLALLLGWLWALHAGWRPQPEDFLTVMTASYLLFLAAGCLAFFGTGFTRAIVFPLGFLAFMIPMPAALLAWTEMFFQQTSAATAAAFLDLAGMSVFRDDLVLHLPTNFSLVVAPECSGIHSTMVLAITAVLAGHLFLRSGWKRLLLVLFVVPLAIARNGFRVFVIAELCVHVGHQMIDSPIHHKGGPIFFALSLIPFFALLLFLRKTELQASKTVDTREKV
jgi:exosortase C (VPDSG-CTERM-specific)